MRPLAEFRREARPHRVFEDVSRDRECGLVVSQDPLVVSGLSERMVRRLAVPETRGLLRVLHKPGEIRAFPLRDQQQVNVIRHHAVRNNCDPESIGRGKNL